MEQDLIQIFELFLALAAAVVAFWQHRQKLVAVDAKDEALVERDLAEARQWESEALKDNVISFFDPEDESVVKAPPEVAGPGPGGEQLTISLKGPGTGLGVLQ